MEANGGERTPIPGEIIGFCFSAARRQIWSNERTQCQRRAAEKQKGVDWGRQDTPLKRCVNERWECSQGIQRILRVRG
jgi:hypothetical protein